MRRPAGDFVVLVRGRYLSLFVDLIEEAISVWLFAFFGGHLNDVYEPLERSVLDPMTTRNGSICCRQIVADDELGHTAREFFEGIGSVIECRDLFADWSISYEADRPPAWEFVRHHTRKKERRRSARPTPRSKALSITSSRVPRAHERRHEHLRAPACPRRRGRVLAFGRRGRGPGAARQHAHERDAQPVVDVEVRGVLAHGAAIGHDPVADRVPVAHGLDVDAAEPARARGRRAPLAGGRRSPVPGRSPATPAAPCP